MDPSFPDINITKTSTNISNYNIEVLQKVLQIDLQQSKEVATGEGEATTDKGATTEGTTPSGEGATPSGEGSTPSGEGATPSGEGSTPSGEGATPEVTTPPPARDSDWRHMSSPCHMDLLIISSFGECDPSIEVAPKQQDNEMTYSVDGIAVLARKEIEIIIDRCREDETIHLQEVCPDWPGAQLSKNDHMDRIKKFLQHANREGSDGALIHYTGHGEKDTGNWCFKDGVISFQDIFGLYMDFRGKRLTIASDCSYSGNWINECIKKLDEIGIPSCGHHTREQGILLKVFASTKTNEEATMMCFAKEGISIGKNSCLIIPQNKLSSGQTTDYGDFRQIRCSKEAKQECEIIASTWKDRHKYRLVYLVRGKDGGRAAWHYVLVDEDKLDEFKAKIASGTIDVAKYGKVLDSGYGKDPPKDIKRKIELKYGSTVDPE